MSNETNAVVMVPVKSIGLSLLLTFLFGSLGMLYSTVIGALIMLVVEAVLGFITFGWAILITHPICMIWAAIAVKKYNKRFNL